MLFSVWYRCLDMRAYLLFFHHRNVKFSDMPSAKRMSDWRSFVWRGYGFIRYLASKAIFSIGSMSVGTRIFKGVMLTTVSLTFWRQSA